jgi:Raf kinase inhibitor-like YbhB/YbcL family protein
MILRVRVLGALFGMSLIVATVASCGGAGKSAEVTGGRNEANSPLASGAQSAAASPSTSAAPAASAGGEEETKMPFTLTSTDFSEDGSIPRKFSCDGEDVSPALSWDGAPDDTHAFALIVDDPDARGFVHWVVFDTTGSQSGGLAEAVSASPDAPTQGRNGFGRIGWGGPCPPSGTHHYQFTLLALDEPLGLTGTPSADDVRRAAEGHTLAQATLTGTYTRGS